MDPTVTVLRLHLEEIWNALDTAHAYHLADDLRTGYKNVGGTSRESNLTKRLEHARDRLDTYLIEEEDVPEE